MRNRILSNIHLQPLDVQSLGTVSLLPFLYQTRTIAGSPNLLLGPYRSCCKLHGTAWTNTRDSATRSRDFIPFEDDHRPGAELENDPRPTGKGSTITASEQAIFDRIFKRQAQEAAKQRFAKVREDELEPEEEGEGRYRGIGDISAIFDTAVEELDQREKAEANSKIEHSKAPRTFPQQPARIADVLPLLSESPSSSHRDVSAGARSFHAADARHEMMGDSKSLKDLEETKEAAVHQSEEVCKALTSAKTDTGLWGAFSKHVLNLVSDLKAKIATEEAAKKTKENVKGRRRAVDPKRLHDDRLSAEVLLYTLQCNYSYFALTAQRSLRRNFPLSPYCLQVLPAIKREGSLSRVLGVSTALYNEIMLIKWTQYRDLHGVADLLEEMQGQGLEGNDVTLRLLQSIGSMRRSEKKGNDGAMKQAWWGMLSVEEGWGRLSGAYDSVKNEMVERRVRRDAEEQEDEEAAGQNESEEEGGIADRSTSENDGSRIVAEEVPRSNIFAT